jgi:hypothetical protein
MGEEAAFCAETFVAVIVILTDFCFFCAGVVPNANHSVSQVRGGRVECLIIVLYVIAM